MYKQVMPQENLLVLHNLNLWSFNLLQLYSEAYGHHLAEMRLRLGGPGACCRQVALAGGLGLRLVGLKGGPTLAVVGPKVLVVHEGAVGARVGWQGRQCWLQPRHILHTQLITCQL